MLTTIRRLTARKNPGRPSAPARVRPRLHCLEERALPSTTLFVDDDGRQFRHSVTSIQAAVNAAHDGDTIYVARGTYREQVVVPSTLHHVSLVSAGGATLVAPTTAGDGSGAIVHVNGASDVRVTGFTITGGGGTATLQFGVLV